MDVLILITGGTFDKVHDTFTEGLVLDGASRVPDVLARGRTDFPNLRTLMQIDSLDMEDAHREAIVTAVKEAEEDHIVITHGTGTLELSAKALDKALGTTELKKTVVLTGAMRPHSLGQSDASFNLGAALIAAQTLPAGVYGVMNGRVIPAADLHKDVATGRFV